MSVSVMAGRSKPVAPTAAERSSQLEHRMELPANKHDAPFKPLVSRPKKAGELLWSHLPAELVERLNTSIDPEPVDGSFIDAVGRSTQCDALFRVALKTGGEAGIYLLLEHKSRIDPVTPVQVLK